MAKTEILIVEDDGIIAEDIKSTIQTLGYAVSAVEFSGEGALRSVEENKPDLVLMDIVLQGEMDGIDAANQIRSRFNIPVVYLTAYADEKTLERAKITEPFGYIIKPFEDRELQSTIETALYKSQMEKKLRESEEWLSTTLRSIGDAVIATDTAGYVTFINPVAQSLTGWKQEDAVGKSLKDVFNIINEETGRKVENPVTRVIQKGVVVGLANHTILIAKDGTKIPIDDSGAPIRDDKENIIGVILVFHDITERKKAEEALRGSEERLRTVIEASLDSIVAVNDQGVIELFNPAAEELFLYSPDEVLNKPVGILLLEDVAETHQKRLERFLNKGAGQCGHIGRRVERTFKRKDGSQFEAEIAMSGGRGNGLRLVVVSIRDITERKRAEREIFLLQKINNMLNAGVNRDEVFETIVNGLRSLYNYDSVAIHLLSKDQKHMTIKSYSADSRVARKLEKLTGLTVKGYSVPLYEGSLLKEVVDTKKPVITDDIAWVLKSYTDRKSLQRMAKTAAKLTKARWGVGVPLLAGDTVVGTIGCGSEERLTDTDAERLAIFGAEAGLAIEKHRRYEILEEKVEERTRELAESEEKYRGLVETSQDMIWKCDAEGRFIYLNPAWERTHGYTVEEMLGRRFTEFQKTEVAKRDIKEFERQLAGGSVKGYETSNLTKSGSEIHLVFNAVPLFDSSGKIMGTQGTAYDITERKMAEEALKQSEEKYRNLAENLHEVVYRGDPETFVATYVNSAIKEVYGYSVEEWLKNPDLWAKSLHPDDIDGVIAAFMEAKRKKGDVVVEYRIIRKDKSMRWVTDSVTWIKDKQGKIISVNGILYDITERKKAEEALKKRTHDLGERVKELKGLYGTSQLIETPGITTEEVFLRAVDLIPPSWQYPDITYTRITFGGKEFKTANWKASKWMQSSDIITEKGKVGVIEVAYLEEKPEIDEGPFLKEERQLIDGLARILGDFIERKHADEELRQYREHLEEEVQKRTTVIKDLKEFNENIVQSMEEGILIENDEGLITFANPRMLEMLGCSKDEIIGKHCSEIFSQDSKKKVKEESSQLRGGKKTRYEAALKLGETEKQVMVSATPQMEDNIYTGSLKVFIDITERKEAEEKLRQKALRYKIERGRSYLVTEKTLDRGMDVFIDLTQAGSPGMIISRTQPEEFKDHVDEDVDVLWLSEGIGGGGIIPPQPNLVLKAVGDFASRNSVVLLDRLDYLIVQNSFNEVLKLLQKLNEKVYMAKAILLVVVDPDTLSKQELSLLEKEIKGVEAKYQVDLDKNLRDILEFINEENRKGRMPTHKDLMKNFNITRPTASKRLKELKTKGLLVDKKRGKSKILEITERGKEVL